jgi:lysophospholipase L1-like esterase
MKLSPLKIAIFSLLPLFALAVTLEVGIRIAYFQAKSNQPIALTAAFQSLRAHLAEFRARRAVGEMQRNRVARSSNFLYQPIGKEMLKELESLYESHFRELHAEALREGALVVLLYIPSDDYKNSVSLEPSRAFFRALARKFQAPFVDLTDEFMKYPLEAVSLLPENSHLSRFGNQLVAKELAKTIEKIEPGFRSQFRFEERPALLGDLPAHDVSPQMVLKRIPFITDSNGQGLRMEHDLSFPKQKQRILALGDSFTFGPFLPLVHTYTHILQGMFPEREIINAGVAGYTISSEKTLFLERSKYTEPDVVVVQTLDNDIMGLFSYLAPLDRSGAAAPATEAEIRFAEKLEKAGLLQ